MDCKIIHHMKPGDYIYGKATLLHHFFMIFDEDDYHEVTKWCEANLQGKWTCFPEMVAKTSALTSEAMIHITTMTPSDAMLIRLSF